MAATSASSNASGSGPKSGAKTGIIVGLLVVAALAVFLVTGHYFDPKPAAPLGGGLGAEAPGAISLDAKPEAPEELKNLDPGLASAFDAAGSGDVTVRLLTYKDRKPLVGQPVRLSNARGDSVERLTGENGRVLFSAVHAGRDWVLNVEGKGFAPVEMKGVAVKSKGTTDLLDLLLGAQAVLRGRVLDGKGQPIPGAAVSAYVGGVFDMSSGIIVGMTQSALTFPTPTEEVKTDERGLFTLATLTPGASYELKTKHSGYAFSVQTNLVVSPEKTSGQLTIILQPAATLKGKVIDEEGRPVANATIIALEDAGAMGGFGRGGAGFGTMKKDFTRSKADGTYVLDTLNRNQAYRFGVSAVSRAPMFDSQPTTMDGDLTRDFTLVKGGSLAGTVTDAQTGAPIEGARVVAIVGNMAMMGPRMGRGGSGGGGGASTGSAADSAASTQIALTGPDGTYKLDGLRPGSVAVGQVKAAGYADKTDTSFMGGTGWGEVKAGETLTVDVKLESGGSIIGKVLAVGADGARTPVVGAQVAVMTMMSGMTGYPTAVSGEDGSFRVDGVRPGKMSIVASAPRFVVPNPTDEASQVTVPDVGGIIEKDVLLSSAGAVEGVATNSKGVPVPGARVRVTASITMGGMMGGRGGAGGGRSMMGGVMRMLMPNGTGGTVLTDGDGRYRVETVAADEKMLVVGESDEYVSSESEPFTVKAGETAKADLVFQGGGTIRGRVIDDRGGIVAAAKLRVGHLDADTDAQKDIQGFRADLLLEQRFVSSGVDGSFEIDKLKPGRTLLKVEHDGHVAYYRRDLTIQPDQVMDNYVVTLTKGETISGVVKGEDGKLVAGAMVAVTKQQDPAGFGAAAAPAPAGADEGAVEPSMNDRTDAQGKFTIDNVPPGSGYSVVVWFAMGYKGYGQNKDLKAIVRGVSSNTRDVEFTLVKQDPVAPGGFQFPGAGTGGPRPTMPAPPPGMGTGGTPPTVPGMN